jgi:hypothetical protein
MLVKTKQELYKIAKELDIKGRSKMSKEELIDAIENLQKNNISLPDDIQRVIKKNMFTLQNDIPNADDIKSILRLSTVGKDMSEQVREWISKKLNVQVRLKIIEKYYGGKKFIEIFSKRKDLQFLIWLSNCKKMVTDDFRKDTQTIFKKLYKQSDSNKIAKYLKAYESKYDYRDLYILLQIHDIMSHSNINKDGQHLVSYIRRIAFALNEKNSFSISVYLSPDEKNNRKGFASFLDIFTKIKKGKEEKAEYLDVYGTTEDHPIISISNMTREIVDYVYNITVGDFIDVMKEKDTESFIDNGIPS